MGNVEAVARLQVIADEGNMPNMILAVGELGRAHACMGAAAAPDRGASKHTYAHFRAWVLLLHLAERRASAHSPM